MLYFIESWLQLGTLPFSDVVMDTSAKDTKGPVDASQFVRDDKEVMLGGKEVGTNAIGLGGTSGGGGSIDESPQLIKAGGGQASGVPSGAGSLGNTSAVTSELNSQFSHTHMPGQGHQAGAGEGAAATGIPTGTYQGGFAEGQTGVGGVHISNSESLQPQKYGTPNQPGSGQGVVDK
ncbi:hypothetical protein RvY_04694 [Ramazzottius varieornatus]|uniref:Uncharacterized protein n=1 Tax=Ramazzottius varieornatus TaxID=947166 RepID=A0A1D1UT55_RAMVA|nr:hypothetical protein RvY_04694 [Ramazzottius varieornatus]